MDYKKLAEKYQEIMSNEELVAQFMKLETAEEMRKFFRDHGMEGSDDDLNGVLEAMADVAKEPLNVAEEVSEKELESVAGGLSWGGLAKLAKATWEAGTWVAGKLVYGSQSKAKKEIKKYWRF